MSSGRLTNGVPVRHVLFLAFNADVEAKKPVVLVRIVCAETEYKNAIVRIVDCGVN